MIGTTLTTANEILDTRDHRPFPLPARRWMMRQEWHNLLFAHWSFDPDLIRPLVPTELTLDLWQGRAYVAVTPFVLRHLRPRGTPHLPGISNFPEVNVRTYVRFRDQPGVYFFSLDAGNLSAVAGARMMYRLPYHLARMTVADVDGQIAYSSRRVSPRNAPETPELHISYSPCGDVLSWSSPSESLERFLTERYCLYTVTAGRIYRTQIHHVPWPLQPASAEIQKNTMVAPLRLPLEGKPLFHFSRFIDVLVWWPERVA
jgi:uncharacterized protein YqjF (DUF2071 family)